MYRFFSKPPLATWLVVVLTLCLGTLIGMGFANSRPNITTIHATPKCDGGILILRKIKKSTGGGTFEQRIDMPAQGSTVDIYRISSKNIRMFLVQKCDGWRTATMWDNLEADEDMSNIRFEQPLTTLTHLVLGGQQYEASSCNNSMGGNWEPNMENLLHSFKYQQRHENDQDPGNLLFHNDNPTFAGKTLLVTNAKGELVGKRVLPLNSLIRMESSGQLRGGNMQIVSGRDIIATYPIECSGTSWYETSFAFHREKNGSTTLRVGGDEAEIKALTAGQ